MRVTIVSDVHALEDEWWELWRRDPAATPFQSPAWLLPWQKQFAEGKSLVVALRNGERLAALLPLFRHEGKLLLWGAGTSDWLDGVFDPALDPGVLSPVLSGIGAPFDFFQLSAGSPLLAFPVPAGWSQRLAQSEHCVVVPLPAAPAASMARNLRYYRRRTAAAGIGEPQRSGAASFDDLAELHGRRWKERNLPGVLADPRVLAWHREALPRLETAGLLRFYVLRSAGQTVAAIYVLNAKRRSFYYIGGFDPAFADLGLGTVLVGHAIAEAEHEDARSFDFLRGGEAYKYRWGGCDQPSFARILQPPGF